MVVATQRQPTEFSWHWQPVCCTVHTGGAETPLLLVPVLGLATVDRILQSLGDTKSDAGSRSNLPPPTPAVGACLQSNKEHKQTHKGYNYLLFSHFGHTNYRCRNVWAVQRVASAPPGIPRCYEGNVVTESVWESRGAAALTFGFSVDRFVPEKPSCSLTEAAGSKIQFKQFWKDNILCVRQEDGKVSFSLALYPTQ